MTTRDERTVARLKRQEDGSISNPRMEMYALLRSEAVVTNYAAWIIITATGPKKTPGSGSYQAKIHQSPVFKRRLEELVTEREQLQAQGVWGQLEWQIRQNYRRAVAMNDPRSMVQATEQLMKIAFRNEKPAKPEKDAADDEPRGRGAPPAPTPLENANTNRMREKLASL